MREKKLTLKMKKMVRRGCCPDCETKTLEIDDCAGGVQCECSCSSCGAEFKVGAVNVERVAAANSGT